MQYLILYLFLILFNQFSSAFKIENMKLSKQNLPLKSDLIKYLLPLKGVTNYCWNNKNEIDVNFAFGIFLTNVNLGHIYKAAIPERELKLIRDIYDKNEEILSNFRHNVELDFNFQNWKYQIISALFTNTSEWINRMNRLRVRTQPKNKHITYPKWNDYVEDVGNVFKWIPNPLQSDKCLTSLAYNNVILRYKHARCLLARPCYRILKKGTNFGYALSHRLLLLLMARLSSNCSIFTEKDDIMLKETLCSMGLDEVEYIASNDYKQVDLMLEFMCLCSLDGHAEFLQTTWLKETIKFQTEYGCFSQKMRSREMKRSSRVWKLNRSRDLELLAGKCNGHTTALASSTLASAIRYVLVTYY